MPEAIRAGPGRLPPMVTRAQDKRPSRQPAPEPQGDHLKRIVILGGGTGGTLTANRLRRSHDEQAAEIVVVDHDADHVCQPGLLFVPFGLTSRQRIVRPRRQQFRSGISFRQAGIDRAGVEADRVHLNDGTAPGYDGSWSPRAHGCCPRRPTG